MSLAALALRSCVFLTLYRRTLAEERVFDSALSTIDELRTEEPKPFITIAIDEASGTPNGHGLLSAIDRLSIVIEIGIGRQVEVEGGNDVIRLPLTDGGLENALDIITYQITRLLSSDPGWGDLFRSFVLRVQRMERIRGGAANSGDRFAARQIVLEVEPLSDPDLDTQPEIDQPWSNLLAALRALDVAADEDLQAYVDLADALESAIVGDASMVDWQVQQARLGISIESTANLGITPHDMVLSTDPVPVPLETVVLLQDPEPEPDGTFDVTDEARADAVLNVPDEIEGGEA